jgi:hypothetical protein
MHNKPVLEFFLPELLLSLLDVGGGWVEGSGGGGGVKTGK